MYSLLCGKDGHFPSLTARIAKIPVALFLIFCCGVTLHQLLREPVRAALGRTAAASAIAHSMAVAGDSLLRSDASDVRNFVQGGAEASVCEHLFPVVKNFGAARTCDSANEGIGAKRALGLDFQDKANINHGLHQVIIPWVTALHSCGDFLKSRTDNVFIIESFYDPKFERTPAASCGDFSAYKTALRRRWIQCGLFLPLLELFGETSTFEDMDLPRPGEGLETCFSEIRSFNPSGLDFERTPTVFADPEDAFTARGKAGAWSSMLSRRLAHQWAVSLKERIDQGDESARSLFHDQESIPRLFEAPEALTIRILTYTREDTSRRPFVDAGKTLFRTAKVLGRRFPDHKIEFVHAARWPSSYFGQAYLMSEASDIVFMPHGATNANTFFMSPKAVYVETSDRCARIDSKRNQRWAGWASDVIGFRRILLPCESLNPNGEWGPGRDTGNDNFPMRVDFMVLANGFEEAIREVLRSRGQHQEDAPNVVH